MRKQGILFQGLCIIEDRHSPSLLKEEPCHYQWENRGFPETEGRYVDVTYFLAYVIGKNRVCRAMVLGMEEEWREYLRSRARSSFYSGEYFWHCLTTEESLCAEAALGLLEDIRGEEEERAELAWIGFWYLLYKGFQEAYDFFKENSKTTFQIVCRLARKKKKEQFTGLGYLCVEFLFAEELGVEIEKDGNYPLFYSCMKKCGQLWESTFRQKED